MAKYIDADRLQEKLIERLGLFEELSSDTISPIRIDECKKIIGIITSLQQERPKVDLEKDVESWFFNKISSKINVEHTMYYYFQECAQRYFELGKNSK